MSGTPAVEKIEKKAKKKQEKSEKKEAEKNGEETSESSTQTQEQIKTQTQSQDQTQSADKEDRVNMDGVLEQSTQKPTQEQEKGDGEQIPPRGHNQSGPPPEDPQRPDFVRWSPSTELGDFIRDAARAKEFAVDIEGAPESILVGVPSFNDRTFYLRMRLRKTSRRILQLADIKQECDRLARKGAQRVVSSTSFHSWLHFLTYARHKAVS